MEPLLSLSFSYSTTLYPFPPLRPLPRRSPATPTTSNTRTPFRVTLKSTLTPIPLTPSPLNLSLTFLRPLQSGTTTSHVGLTLALSPASSTPCIMLTLHFRRATQKLSVPLLVTNLYGLEDTLARGISTWTALLGATVAGLVGWEFLVSRPWRELESKVERRRNRYWIRQRMVRKRKEAEAALALLQPIAERKSHEEQAEDGLVILSATYGVHSSSSPFPPLDNQQLGRERKGKERVIDVTVPLQALVSNHQLALQRAQRRTEIEGVWDPVPGRRKELWVVYEFGRVMHAVKVRDGEGCVMPNRGHVVV
ncbi:hypothetical protein BDZ91DRAFT_738771 [Kalaharituber pfeilii]|nr:hypothetical protein BDZ91DRAFT_738771 [Kalaharituber pfeilii]